MLVCPAVGNDDDDADELAANNRKESSQEFGRPPVCASIYLTYT